jgi:hypothetical protein
VLKVLQTLEENLKALDVTLSSDEVLRPQVRALVKNMEADLVSGSARYPPGHYERFYAETLAWNSN